MKNRYTIEGDIITMYITMRNGDKFETYFDLEDFDKIDKSNLSWHMKYAQNTKSYYIRATANDGYSEDGKRKQRPIYLHKLIMDADFSKGEQVDHLDHDTLNNRKYNLKIKDNTRNATNRHGANRNSTTGVRNVFWSSGDQRYVVQLQVEGRNKRFGSFKNLDEAANLAEKLREEIYGSIYD